MSHISCNLKQYILLCFSSYGEGLFLAIQTALVAALVLFYGGKTIQCALFTILYTLIMSYLLSPLVSIQILAVFQSINIGIVILSKVMCSNYILKKAPYTYTILSFI
jgi:hypothetical protein